MSAYCTIAEVRTLLQEMMTLSTDSRPTAVEATSLITRVSGDVDSELIGSGFSLPIGAPEALQKIGLAVSKEVAYMCIQTKGVSADTPRLCFTWHTDYLAFIDSIREKIFSDGTAAAGESAKSYTMNAATDTSDSSIQPKITKEMEF